MSSHTNLTQDGRELGFWGRDLGIWEYLCLRDESHCHSRESRTKDMKEVNYIISNYLNNSLFSN